MTDATDPTESPEVAEVRRLLAGARHREPMPDEVVARMSGVLGSLGSETAAAPAPRDTTVVPISARRRRNAAGLLVAAAAIVVGGITLAPHLHVATSGSGGSENAAGGSAAGFDSQSHGASGKAQPRAASSPTGSVQLRGGRLVVRPGHFTADARQGLRLLRYHVEGTSRTAPPCAGVPQHARSVPAEYQKAPAALVYGPPEGSARTVDLYVCGDSRPVRSTTLSGP